MRCERRLSTAIAVTVSICAVGGCAVIPPAGPSVMALPSNGKTTTAMTLEGLAMT